MYPLGLKPALLNSACIGRLDMLVELKSFEPEHMAFEMQNERKSQPVAAILVANHQHFDKWRPEEMGGHHTIGSNPTIYFRQPDSTSKEPRSDFTAPRWITQCQGVDRAKGDMIVGGGGSNKHDQASHSTRDNQDQRERPLPTPGSAVATHPGPSDVGLDAQ
jgi:hypothetical protein